MQHLKDEYRIATVQRAANVSGNGWPDILTDTDEAMVKANTAPELVFLPFRDFFECVLGIARTFVPPRTFGCPFCGRSDWPWTDFLRKPKRSVDS
jgi:hypothetical protein